MRDYVKRIMPLMLSSIAITIIMPNMCSAWAGFKPSSGSGGGQSSYSPTNCATIVKTVRSNDCNGVSWAYYRFTGTTEKKEIIFKPGEGGQVISGDCAQEGTGFWHLGYNATFDDYHDPLTGNLLTDAAMSGWSAADGGNIQVGDVSASRLNIGATFYMMPFNGSNEIKTHILKYGSENYYTSAYYGSEETVKAAYNALPDSDKKDSDGNIIGWRPNDLYAFCSPDPEAKTTFTGASSATIDGTSISHGNSIEIHSASGKVKFSHTIKRGNSGSSSAKKAKYYVNSQGSGQDIGSDSDWKYTEGLAKSATSSAIVTAEKNVSVDPGGSTWIWSRLWFYKTLQGTNYSDKSSPNYSANSNCGSTAGRYCIGLTRPYAKFTGSVTATVKKNSARTNVSIPANHVINLADSDDGYYEISFTDTVKRNNNDGAGGNVKTQYNASRREASSGGVSVATWNPTSASSSGDTNALAEGGPQNVFTPKVSGTLKYGESRKFCSSMSYRARQKTNDAMTAATGSEFCVTITRPKAKCAIDGVSEYGIKEGYNVGAIGIKNFSYKPNGSFSWTKVNTNSTTHNLSYDDANVWAMPGDDIQFKYGGCAGAYYAIEMSGITGKGTHYSTAGWITSNAFGTDGSTVGNRYFGTNGTNGDGFLFKGEATVTPYTNPVNKNNANLAAITSTTPSPYAKWTTGYNGGTKVKSSTVFLGKPDNGDPVAEMYGDTNVTGRVHSAKSPSRSGYGGSTAGTYKICGTSSSDCMFKKQNVGSIIVQQLTWNYLRIQNAAVTEGPKVHSATGIVRVPYNYYLRPFVKNEDESGVVYLGETKDMYPGVAVFPRKNTLVHGGATYATITKETHASVRVYNQRTKAVLKSTNFTKRLNKDGKITTTAAEDTNFMQGGIGFDIIDNGNNWVGDKICTELTIWPIDSHETGNGSTVYGASANSSNIAWDQQYALSETGIMNADGTPYHKSVATSCSTIAKRPTMSVESSNAYSATTYSTGVYAKNFGGDKKYIFGSWSEYGVFGRLNLTSDGGKTFVSGAAIGYGTNINNTQRNIGRENNSSQGVATDDTGGKTCLFMTQTLINLVDNKCGTDKDNGTDKSNVGSDAMSLYRDNILERYGTIGKDDKTKKNKITDKLSNDDSRINLNIKADDIEKYRVEEGNANSIVGIYAAGNAVLDQTPKFATNTNKTIVYNVDGTLTIRGNINDERNKSMSTISDPTGVIIIANKVWIDAAVDYINATIITRDVDDAEVNTCKTSGGTTIKIGTGNSDSKRGTLSSAVCYKTLVFDGPVFTSRIILNRTGGAGLGADSIKRAEIFNLNMANYLWSFNQMTHYSQAVTTYSRELPTRY